MSSFPSPARPRLGRFPFGTTGLRGADPRITVRVSLIQPASGRTSLPGDVIRFLAVHIDEAGESVDAYKWTVRVFRGARVSGHHHFWYAREIPYRTYVSRLPPGSAFELAAEEADRGYSTWEVRVTALRGDVVRGEGVAVFALEVEMLVLPAVDITPVFVAAELSDTTALLPFPVFAIEATTGTSIPLSSPAMIAEPAHLLDPLQVG